MLREGSELERRTAHSRAVLRWRVWPNCELGRQSTGVVPPAEQRQCLSAGQSKNHATRRLGFAREHKRVQHAVAIGALRMAKASRANET